MDTKTCDLFVSLMDEFTERALYGKSTPIHNSTSLVIKEFSNMKYAYASIASLLGVEPAKKIYESTLKDTEDKYDYFHSPYVFWTYFIELLTSTADHYESFTKEIKTN